MTAEQQRIAQQQILKSKAEVKAYLSDDAAKIRKALSSTDSALWEWFGEMEREKIARKNNMDISLQ